MRWSHSTRLARVWLAGQALRDAEREAREARQAVIAAQDTIRRLAYDAARAGGRADTSEARKAQTLLEQDAAEAEVIVSAHTDAVTDARRALRETILEHANRKPARVPRRIPPPRGVKARPAGRDVRLHLLPLGLLQLLRARLADGGRVLLETYGINHEDGSSPYIHVHRPGDVYPDDEFVY
jgi:hypothetical protein